VKKIKKGGYMNELALFAGAGGGILGGHLLGWRTVCAVEIEEYPRSVLLARQDDGLLPPFPIWDDICTFDGRPWRGIVDVVSGGFPCQDISAAGKGAGITGERSGLWREMARVIGEVRPRFVFVENSPLLVGRGLAVVLADLAKMGYDARWGVVGAHHAGAPHKRDRIWIMASDANEGERRRPSEMLRLRDDSFGVGSASNVPAACQVRCDSGRAEQPLQLDRENGQDGNMADAPKDGRENGKTGDMGSKKGQEGCRRYKSATASFDCGPNSVPDSSRERLEKQRSAESSAKTQPELKFCDWWAVEPGMGRVAHGVAHRVDRIKALGNGQVAAVAALAWRILGGE
jgi:DNA (cytosine-5)-methyltransferase 1